MNSEERFREESTAAWPTGREPSQPVPSPDLPKIKIDKTIMPRETEGRTIVAEIFTMTLGNETILLEPLKNWIQLDTFKWRARGLLPRTPAGLDVTACQTR
jgi:hypothetical protein